MQTIEQRVLSSTTDQELEALVQLIVNHTKQELARFRSIQDAQVLHAQVNGITKSIRELIKDRNLKLQVSNDLTLSRIHIERWVGQWLAKNIKQGGSHGGTLLQLGLTKNQSSRWQLEAIVPESELNRIVKTITETSSELTSKAIYDLGKRLKQQEERENERAKAVETEKTLPSTNHKDCLYHDEWISLWHGDAGNLNFIEDNTIDLIVTSPPYNIGPKVGKGRVLWGGIDYLDHNDVMLENKYQEWQIDVLNELWRVIRPGGSLFYNHKIRNRDKIGIHPFQWIALSKWTFRQEIVWNRGSTHNKEMSYFWPNNELIFWLTKGTDKVYLSPEGARMGTVWEFNFEINSDHPAPFPKELPARCIKAASKKGDIVLDPFGGSMTTCHAAREIKRKAIGVDISRTYVTKYSLPLTQRILL